MVDQDNFDEELIEEYFNVMDKIHMLNVKALSEDFLSRVIIAGGNQRLLDEMVRTQTHVSKQFIIDNIDKLNSFIVMYYRLDINPGEINLTDEELTYFGKN